MTVESLGPAIILIVVLMWTLTLVVVVLRKSLGAPGRSVRVTVRPLPWPRIDIQVTTEDA